MSQPDSSAPRDVVAETPPAPTGPKKPGQIKAGSASTRSKGVDLYKIAALDDDAHHGKGSYYSGSFMPDSRFLVLSICTYIGRTFSETEFEASQFVTPPALIAYYLYVMYFLLYIKDIRSKSPSYYARTFTDFHRHDALLRLFSKVYIPDQIFAIFTAFSEWSPELLPNFQFVPSLAHALPLYDIPYLVHPLIFLIGHNSLFRRADLVGKLGEFLTATVTNYTSASLNTGNEYALRVGNLLGCAYQTDLANAATLRYYPNWLSNVITPFIDPATHRQHLRRTGIAKFDIEPFTSTSANWNPYTFLFSTSSPRNFEAVLDCISACSDFSREQLNASKTFDDLLKMSSPAPGSYMIMDYSTPTWNVSGFGATLPADGMIPVGTFDALATSMRFGVVPTAPTAGRAPFTIPEDPTAPGTIHPDLIQAMYLVNPTNALAPAVPNALTVEARNEYRHSRPNVLVFQPGDATVETAAHSMFAGIVVHNGNVDSTILRTPNPRDEIPMILSRYFDGFIGTRIIRPRFAGRSTYLVVRQAIERISTATIALLWRSDQVTLPSFDRTRTYDMGFGTTWSRFVWPFRRITNVVLPFFGFNLATDTTHNQIPADTTIATTQVVDAWSSFRIGLNSDRDRAPTERDVAFGINHGEVLFGRNSTLTKFSHPADILRRN